MERIRCNNLKCLSPLIAGERSKWTLLESLYYTTLYMY